MFKTDLNFELVVDTPFMRVSCTNGMHYKKYIVMDNHVTRYKLIHEHETVPIEYLDCPAYTKYGDYIRFLMVYLKINTSWYLVNVNGLTRYVRQICLKLT